MSREYVATLSECLRLFLPPGGSPRVVKGDDGVWTVERPAVKPIQNRWVMLTPEGFDYTPPKTAVRQRQLIEALQCGRSRRATSTCSTTACRRPLRRSKNAASWWWKSAALGVAVASRPRCPRRAARRRSRLPTVNGRPSRRLSAHAWTLTVMWCSSMALQVPVKPRSTFRRLSACWRPAVRPACSCPRFR